MSLKVNGAIFLLGCLAGYFILNKFQPKPVAPLVVPAKQEQRKVERVFDKASGNLVSESVVESVSTPQPQPKPRYKIALFPVYSFSTSSIYYGALYEKRYDLPFVREVYLGVYANTKLEVGLSLSKEFY